MRSATWRNVVRGLMVTGAAVLLIGVARWIRLECTGREHIRQPPSDQAMVVIVLATLVAYLLPVAAGWIAWRMARASYVLVKHGIRTTGQVTVRQQRGSRIQYSVGGLTYQIKSEWYVPASVGVRAPVVYPPGSPDQGCVYHWQELWMPAILWLLTAVFFGVLDIWY
jgi:hypothetical protein